MEKTYNEAHFYKYEAADKSCDRDLVSDTARFCADVACICHPVGQDTYDDIVITQGHRGYATRELGRALTNDEATLFEDCFYETVLSWELGS